MKRIISKIKAVVLLKKNDYTTDEERNNERIRRMSWTSLAALFAQLLQMAIPLITVRVTLRYMGEEVYANWTTINSLFSLMTYADMGLGNGLQTTLSQETGKEQFDGRRIVSSTYFVVITISLALMSIFLIVFPMVDWNKIVGVEKTELRALTAPILLAILIPKIISIPLTLVRRTENAMQEGYFAYIFQGIASILSLVSIYITVLLNLGSVMVIFISSSIPVIVSVANSCFYYFKNPKVRPGFRFIDIKIAKNMFFVGITFFILSILNSVSLNLDNYIVSKAASLNDVTPFSLALRATQLINVACTVLSAPLWAANGEAKSRGDYKWISRMTSKLSIISVIIVIIATVILMLVGPFLFNLWVGYDIGISKFLLLGMLLQQIAFAFISPYFMVLNAFGKIKIQIFWFAIFTPIALIAKYLSCLYLGIQWLSYFGTLAYTLFIIIPIFIYTKKIIKISD